MEQHTEPRTRPRVVTIAVALWWASVIIRLVAAAPGIVVSLREAGGAIIGASVGLVFVLAWSALFVWLATRMGRGSGNARLWLAIIAGLAAGSAVLTIVTDGADWGLVDALCIVVAAVLSYLPSARPFFPREERRPRAAEPAPSGGTRRRANASSRRVRRANARTDAKPEERPENARSPLWGYRRTRPDGSIQWSASSGCRSPTDRLASQ